MILSTSRIEKEEKILFYEQDILLDDKLYSGNLQVTIDVDYVSPGIGIALVSDEGLSLKEDGETYLFRIGHNDYSIVRRHGVKVETLEAGPAVNIEPFKAGLKVRIKKINNRIYFYVNDTLLTQKYLPTSLGNYMVGYYSNAGNIINSISIASEIPEGWVVNMNNTNGGYVTFSPNAFKIENCLDKAEVEQVKIKLKANSKKTPYYYLNYEKELIEGENDLKAYVFMSDDDRYVDEEKNILEPGDKFVVQHDCEVSLKFVGTIGKIKNVQISTNRGDFYVGTNYDQTEIKGSFIKIKTADLTKIEWAGTIYGVPNYELEENAFQQYGVVRDSRRLYYPEQCNIQIGEGCYYDYTVNLKGQQRLLIENKNGYHQEVLNVGDTITIFENMDAIIDKLILYKVDGTIVNIILQDTKKQYVPSFVKSPIIVTDENDMPLDLSASYRVVNGNYIFTNIEREVFDAANRIQVEKPIYDRYDAVVVYGIPKDSEIYADKILYSKEENIRDISDYCNEYNLMYENDIYRINKKTGLIILREADDGVIEERYSKLVVDYLKAESYAINYRHELGCYEVDIASAGDTIMYYDGVAEGTNKELINISEYKLLNTNFRNNSYIVLREGE